MKLGRVLGAVVALTGAAHADERQPSVHVGGFNLVQETTETDDILPFASFGGVRATIAWEPRPLPYPDKRGYNVGGALVPELLAGSYILEDRAEIMIGAGVRAELRISQREGGLFRINAKSAIYLAARGMVVGDDRDVVTEGVLGDYLYLGSPLRLGFEVGMTHRQRDAMEDLTGMMVGVYLGYGPR